MKNLKRIISLSAIGAFGLFGLTQTVNAADSEAIIEFMPGEDVPTVVDPSEPELEYDPDPSDSFNPENGYTNETGPLTLDYVSSVDFGENKIEAGDALYESTALRPFIQVTDRRGTGAGWTVTAQASNFETETDEPTLPGALITFENGEAVSTSRSGAPTPQDPVVLNMGGDAADVVTAEADANTGLGSWITRWFPTDSTDSTETNDNVTLEVPAGVATTGEHTATITWTLTSAPGQGGPGEETPEE